MALLFASVFVFGAPRLAQAQQVSLESPIGFFTNVASRLLRSELGVDLNRIQIYPTNQYTPSVHRLLQVTANVYDAATNRPISDYPFLPSVFRPLFTNDGGAIYIRGYAEETGTNLLNATMRDVTDPADRTALQPMDIVYGVPAIVGAKKGWPNFNEFGLESDITVARLLTFHRDVSNAPITRTNQTYAMGISNIFAVEAWNSYSNSFPRALQMTIRTEITSIVTNEEGVIVAGPDGLLLSNIFSLTVVTNLPASNWAGSGSSAVPLLSSFKIPLPADYLALPNSDYEHDFARFSTNAADLDNSFPVPQLWVGLRTRLRFALVDVGAQRVVDYVNMSSSELPLAIADLMADGAECDGMWNGEIGSLFCTNRLSGTDSPTIPTYGIENQINISDGAIAVSYAFWSTYAGAGSPSDKAATITIFRARLLGIDGGGTTTDFAAPLTPRRVIHHYVSWQANDPFVHHTLWDLSDLLGTIASTSLDADTSGSPLGRMLGTVPLNPHYRPWGGNPLKAGTDTSPPTARNLALKDPQVAKSDSWAFPTNEYPSLSWIGKVHRGTPWQTLFLKATNVDAQTWQLWTGVTNVNEAQLTMPTNDWRIVSLIISMLNTNDPHRLFSLNQPSADAWRGVLDGLTVLTNTGSSQFDTLAMSSNSPQAATIANALDTARANQPGQYFRDVGDILATPELTMVSPWLNTTLSGITDEAYEKIPAQLLPLLRPDSIGSIASAGDTLRIQFTGMDGYAYGVQVSSNLNDWTMATTNYPKDGFFRFTESSSQNFPRRFYRSILLP
jgi:hypothetical protein